MKVSEAYGPGKLGISFELFPPKTEVGEAAIYRTVNQLMGFRPSYITCTYGAGGSTRDKTLQIISGVRKQFGCAVASHLTCVNATVDDLRAYLADASRAGIENIVALRGDPPKGESSFTAVQGGLRYANELVELIREEFPQSGIAVAAYPEVHQEAPSADDDLANLKRKVDAGADVILTQLFYNNEDFFRFRDRCVAVGITIPIVPGVLPVTNLAQIQRITSLCGACLPEQFLSDLTAQGDSDEGQFEVGVDFATQQVIELIAAGVPGIHFYVLNKSQATARVLEAAIQTAD